MVKNLVNIAIAFVLSLFFLCIICYVYSYSGVHIYNPSGATDYKWSSYQLKSTMTEGFAWMHMDQDGFNNSYETKKTETDILLMGSSHMEALQIPDYKNVGYLLNEMNPEWHTYNIGMSGHVIYHCVRNMKNALLYYQPTKAVILETNSVSLAESEMLAVINGSYGNIVSYDSSLLYELQVKVPAIKTIYKQIDDWKNLPISRDGNQVETVNLEKEKNYQNVLDDFLGFAKKSIDKNGVSLIIIYHPQMHIDEDGKLVFDTDLNDLKLFRDSCQTNDIIFADASDAFEKLYYEQQVLPYGFYNTAVGAGHLNEYGHLAMAKLLSNIINDLK